MSLFTAALGGAGEAAQGMAQTWIKEESAANLETLRADLEEKKARLIAQLKTQGDKELIDYANSPDVVKATAARETALADAKGETLSPGQQRWRNGKLVSENTRETTAESREQLIREGLLGWSTRAGAGGGTGGTAGKPGADDKAAADRVKAAFAHLKGSQIGDELLKDADAMAAFEMLVRHNANLTGASAAKLVLEASQSTKPDHKGARYTDSIGFSNGQAYEVPSITDAQGNEYYFGGATQKPVDKNRVATYLNDVLVPRAAAATSARPELVQKIRDTIKFLGITPDEFQNLLDDFTSKGNSEREAKRLGSAQSAHGKRARSAVGGESMGYGDVDPTKRTPSTMYEGA